MRLVPWIRSPGLPVGLASLVLALASTGPTLAQTKDFNWVPPVYDLGGGVGLPSVPTPIAPIAPDSTPPRKPVEMSGATSFQKPGDFTFAVPDYTVITFLVDGGGGSAARPVTPIAENPTRYEPDFGTPGYDGGNSALWNLSMVGAGGGFGNGVTAIYRGGCFPRCTSS